MKFVFWLCLALVGYAYFGYPIYLWLLARLRPRPIHPGAILPSVSIIIAVRNEEANLPAKIENLNLTNYPKELLQIVIASDGSSDRTAEILRQHSSRVLPVILDRSNGKASALNEAVRRATGDILVFQDARQSLEPDAIAELVSNLADPSVGAVSGELLLESARNDSSPDGLGIYWKIEKAVRKLESASGSVVGVTGAIYAIRRELYAEIPPGTILDDVFVPMHVVKSGKRVVFQPSAIARDRLFSQKGKEFSRKVRTLTGNYQLLRLEPWLLSPANPLLFRFICHKLLRLAVPSVSGPDAARIGDGERHLLPRGIPGPGHLLRRSCIRSHQTIDKDFQTNRNRSHVCSSQRRCRTRVLQLCRRTKKSMGLVR